MNERIKKLREQSLNAVNKISVERAILITEFYKSDEARGKSVPEQRALSFKYVLENKAIPVNDGELIVGERGPEPKATSTYPEVCLHNINDLEMIDNREKVSFEADEKVKEIYKEQIIPYWEKRSIRDIMFSRLPREWKDSYEAGVFTEFLEQRAPGHTVLGEKMFQNGMEDIIAEIDESIAKLDLINNPDSPAKIEELNAMRISAEAIVRYAERYAAKLEELSLIEKDTLRKSELLNMAAICRKVPAKKPETFHEALQHYWFLHIGVITELNPWDSFNPGRLDQHLIGFFNEGINTNSLTKESAKELLSSFWVKFNNHPAPPKMGVTAKESNTYTDFALINLGGVKQDGSDAVNELSYLILDVIEEMRILQPSSMIQVSKQNPDSFIKKALKIISTGFGQPSVFNTDAIIQELTAQGKDIADARAGGASGCVESGAFGTESYILTGYFNLAKIFEITLNNGFDPRTGKQIGPATGDPAGFSSFDEILKAFRDQVNHFVGIKISGNNIIGDVYSRNMPAPFLSLLIEDCIENGTDYNSGGARYNTTYIQGVGLGSLTDSLTSVKYNVFDKKHITMKELLNILEKNFEGYDDIRKNFIDETPKYGNDEDYPDDLAVEIFNIFHDSVNGRKGPRKSLHRINMLPTTSHVYFGSVIGALPDGRKKGEPLSEGISPVQSADRKGPSAVLKSASKIDHLKTGGTLLNQKFTPAFFKDENSLNKIINLIRGYFRLDGHHIQFNVIDAFTLREAKREPEKHRDLIVRVAGYSDYFVDLVEELQDEIIRRTEHEAV
ncbi:MAG: glycyl radical protein [Candidatus Aminicenantes bacterium]|nr:glycyl radical protein [Candidatus Aminicenantes bacterium]